MIRAVSKKIVHGAAGLSTVLVLLMPVAIIVDVLSRALFGNPLAAVFEGTQYAMLWIPLLAVPFVTLYNEHIVVDLIDGLYNRRRGELLRTVIEITGAVLSLLVVAVLAVMAWDSVITAFEAGTRMNTTLQPPRWIIYSIIPVSMTLAAIVFGLLLTTGVTKLVRSRRERAAAPTEG